MSYYKIKGEYPYQHRYLDKIAIAEDFISRYLKEYEICDKEICGEIGYADLKFKIIVNDKIIPFIIDSSPWDQNIQVIRFYDLVSKNWVNNEKEESIFLGFGNYVDFKEENVDFKEEKFLIEKVHRIINEAYKKITSNYEK